MGTLTVVDTSAAAVLCRVSEAILSGAAYALEKTSRRQSPHEYDMIS